MNMDSLYKLKKTHCVFLKHLSNPKCDSPKDDGNISTIIKCKSEEEE